jgi:sorbitol-specific phosphotransferase system component IIC
MLTHILQIIMCLFVITCCVYSIIGENRRAKQMTQIIKRMREQYEKDKQ